MNRKSPFLHLVFPGSFILTVRDANWKLILDTKGPGGSAKPPPGAKPHIQRGPLESAPTITGQLYRIDMVPYQTTDRFGKHLQEVSLSSAS